jgi:hypothetical protein
MLKVDDFFSALPLSKRYIKGVPGDMSHLLLLGFEGWSAALVNAKNIFDL